MKLLTREELFQLMQNNHPQSVSIYLSTHRAGRDVNADRINFKNKVKEAEKKLTTLGLKPQAASDILAPAHQLLADDGFWQKSSDGLAVFAAPGDFRYYRAPMKMPELAVVTDGFHVKPLLPLVMGDGRFYIIDISRKAVRFLECFRDSCRELEIPGMPANMHDALMYDVAEGSQQWHTGTRQGSGSVDRAAQYHGHGGGDEDAKEDLLQYFQVVDRALRHVLKGQKDPLIFAGVAYKFPILKEAFSYPLLLDKFVAGSADELKPEDLHEKAWPIAQEYFARRKKETEERYRKLTNTGQASHDIREIVAAAHAGRVDSLFCAVGVQQWGQFDPAGATVHMFDEAEPGSQDLLNYAAVQTVLNSGEVYAVEPDQIPDNRRLAAIFRY